MINPPDTQLEKLYSAITDAIISEASDEEINRLIDAHQVPHNREVDTLVGLILRLHTTLLGVQPSPKFAKELKRDLLHSYQEGIVGRIRRLPARVQIAAAVVFLGGFLMIFSRRRADKVSTVIAETI
jgi:hypothetical protein